MPYDVLIVDDSPAMRSFVRRVLELSGIEIGRRLEAGNGLEALDLLRAGPVDLVLTDINMPVMNGEELVRRLASDEAFKRIPVLVVSTDGTESRAHELLRLGARGYVKKPFLPETLREKIEQTLEGTDAIA